MCILARACFDKWKILKPIFVLKVRTKITDIYLWLHFCKPLEDCFFYNCRGTEGERQPNGGLLEACTMLVFDSATSTDLSTNLWHDVACASPQTKQFICETAASGTLGKVIKSSHTHVNLTHTHTPTLSLVFIYLLYCNGKCIKCKISHLCT